MAIAQQTDQHAVDELLLANDAGGDVVANGFQIGGRHAAGVRLRSLVGPVDGRRGDAADFRRRVISQLCWPFSPASASLLRLMTEPAEESEYSNALRRLAATSAQAGLVGAGPKRLYRDSPLFPGRS